MKQGNSFDVLRLLAALLVVLGHAFPLTAVPGLALAGNAVQAIGVKVFFVISGYLILGSWMRDPHVPRFLLRRMLRILPGLCVVVLLSALVLGPLVSTLPVSEYFRSGRVWHYLGNIAFRPQYDLPGVFATTPYPGAVNGSLWSLPAEMAMYVIGPAFCVAGALLLRSARWGVALGALLLVALSMWFLRVAPPSVPPVVYGSSLLSFLDVAPYFLIGGLYALFRWETAFNPTVAAALWLGFTLVQPPGLAAELSLYLLLPYVALTLGSQPTALGQRLHRFGDISYGVYLYGFPLQQCAALLTEQGRHGPWSNFAVVLLPLLLLATLSWRLIEQPLLRFKPQGARVSPSPRTSNP